MSQSRTLYVGMDVHKESIAVASVAQAYGADVVSRGTVGTRPCAIDTLLRRLPSKSQPLVFVYEAGPCGSWLSRYLTKKGRRARKAAQLRRKAFVLRHDSRSTGRAHWSPAHLRGRSAVVCPTPAQQSGFQAYVQTVTEQPARLGRLERARHEQVNTWR
jgi:hypothetical protein